MGSRTGIKGRLIKALLIALLCAGCLCAFSAPRRAYAKFPKPYLTKKEFTLVVKDYFNIRVRKRAGRMVSWSSSHPKVARVWQATGSKAVVKALKTGTTVISAKIGSYTLKCKVSVIEEDQEKTDGVVTWRYVSFKDGVLYSADEKRLASVDGAIDEAAADMRGYKKQSILYLGASRTRDTAASVQDSEVYFYHCGGAGIKWLFKPVFKEGRYKLQGLLTIDTFLKKQPEGTVILDMGGNDPFNIDGYIGLYRHLIDRYPEATFWFMGILPRKKGDPSNSIRRQFNRKLESVFPGQVIDLYDYVYNNKNFKTRDSIHYYPKMTRLVYQKLMNRIRRSVEVNISTGKVTKTVGSMVVFTD